MEAQGSRPSLQVRTVSRAENWSPRSLPGATKPVTPGSIFAAYEGTQVMVVAVPERFDDDEPCEIAYLHPSPERGSLRRKRVRWGDVRPTVYGRGSHAPARNGN